jgi:hypothetical protein
MVIMKIAFPVYAAIYTKWVCDSSWSIWTILDVSHIVNQVCMIRGIWEVGELLLSSSLQPDPTLNDPGFKDLVSNSKPGDSQNAPLQVNLTLIPPSESFTFSH